MNHTKTGRPARGSRVPANSNGKATRQTERESERQPLRSYSQHQERRDMNHNKTGRQCYSPGAGTPKNIFVQPADYLESELTEW